MQTTASQEACNFSEMNLQVGTRLQMTVYNENKSANYYTALSGYEIDEYVLVKTPRVNGFDAPLQVGMRVDRVFSGVAVYTFCSSVESVLKNRFNFTTLTFPDVVLRQQLRKEERAKVKLPAFILRAHDAELMEPLPISLNDLSSSGAQICAESPLGEVDQEIIFLLSIISKWTQEEAKMEITAIIRNTRVMRGDTQQRPDAFLYGVMFQELKKSDQLALQGHVYEALLGGRGM